MHLGYRYNNPLVEAAAARVLEITGISKGKCIFLSSGSEAVEFGVQSLRKTSEKPKLLSMSGSYLAAYGSAGKRSPEEWYFFDWNRCTAACPCQGKCNFECTLLKEIPFEQIGGFVFEPGNTSGLVKLPPKPLVKVLEQKVRQHGGLIMANEVTTGIGRTGEWFGYNHYGLNPDVVAIGKSVGNGYPVSVAVIADDAAKKLLDSGFHYAQSHQNDALGCAVAAEVIDAVEEEGLIERSRVIGAQFKNGLEKLAMQHESIREVRGRGLMLAMEFNCDDASRLTKVHRELFESGFIIGHSASAKVFRFYPALVITEEDIGKLLDKLDSILKGSE
jgi:acetylornithine aminotransferase